MKIVICCLNLYGGGAERVASLWAKGFYDQGHEVILFLCENKITYDIPKLPVVIIGNGQSVVKQYAHWYRTFKKEFARLKPNVFISVNHPWAIIAKAAAIGTNLKVISTEHNAYEKPEYIKMSFSDKLHKFVFNKFVDKVTVLTQADKDYIGSKLNNVHVMPNPLTFAPVSKVPTKEKIILAVGRLNSWHVKGFDLIIRAWKEIAPTFPEWKLKIIGYGTDENREYIHSLAEDIDSSQFETMDFDENILEQYKRASVFVLSSRYEGFGMVLIEAMSQGCACIACDYKGRQKEIVTDGVDGLIAESDNSNSIKDVLIKLLGNDELQKSLQQYAIEKSKHFLLNTIMNKWNKIIK